MTQKELKSHSKRAYDSYIVIFPQYRKLYVEAHNSKHHFLGAKVTTIII